MKKKLMLALSLVLTVCLLSSCAYLPLLGVDISRNLPAADPAQQTAGDTVTIPRELYERYQKLDTVLDIMDLVEMGYYEEVDESKLYEGAAAGVLAATGDPYTFYYTAEEYAEMWADDEGEYGGVGIQISASYLTGICTISRVFDNGPAREAGVHKGDILYKVEDMYVTATNLDDAVDIMRGTPGTTVNVTFLRGDEEMNYDLMRAQISVNRIDSMMLTGDVGYIYLYEFAGDCAARFKTALEDLLAKGAKGLIIDLRDNPGGWINDAESIGDLFMDEGVLCYLEYKDGQREYYYTKDGMTDIPLVVLMNEHSASSSEILAGALKDRADATIVGVQSYGKGIVQTVMPVGDEGAGMQMTIAQYFTPNGNAVHKLGITPDVEIELPKDDNGMYDFGDLTDPQLSRALEVMQEKMAK